MTSENISDAINMLSDDIIEETDRLRSGSVKAEARQIPVKWGALAACACLLAAGAFAWNFAANWRNGIPTVSPPEESRQNDQLAVVSDNGDESLRSDETAVAVAGDMIAFFIYCGNDYRLCSYVDNAGIVGEKLGTAKGGISCGSSESEYVELAGTVKGDFYEVKGYDPSFMLCMKHEWWDGKIEVPLFIRSTGLELKYGLELFEDRLHISENYSALRYEERDSWYYGMHNAFGLEGNDKLIEKFIAELDSAEFIPRESVPLEEEYESIFDTKLYHLYLEMKNGVSVDFHFLQGGYVIFDGMTDICVKISKETYREMLEAFEGSQDHSDIG
ncbi:MAG: hypothetical protein K2J79_11670 [Ruminiclostridium sp.]|nr:hypothetical protein [Ruminiclostridium sp.]